MFPRHSIRFWAVAGPGAAFAGIMAYGSDPDSLRWFIEYLVLLGIGVLGSSLPHLALPDPQQYLNQLGNLAPAELAASQWRAWRPVALGLFVPGVVLALWPPWDATRVIRGVAYGLTIRGVATYALLHYHRLGPLSQEWSEARRGDAYRWIKENTPYGVPLPDGLVPAFMSTARIFGVGLAAHLAGRLLESAYPALALAPGLALAVGMGIRWRMAKGRFDRLYYHSNAFFREIFTAGRLHVSAARPLPYESLYWIPSRLRPAAWLALVQLDRRAPLGRLTALGHLLLWVMVFRGAPPAAAAVLLGVIVVGQKLTAVRGLGATSLPATLQRQYLPSADWRRVRVWIHGRWALSMALSLSVLALFSKAWSPADVVLWVGIDLVASLIAALVVQPQDVYAG